MGFCVVGILRRVGFFLLFLGIVEVGFRSGFSGLGFKWVIVLLSLKVRGVLFVFRCFWGFCVFIGFLWERLYFYFGKNREVEVIVGK